MEFKNFDDLLKESMKDPEFVKGYEKAEKEGQAAMQIYTLRKSLGLSQAELAKRAGRSQSTIARIENGNMNPRLETLEQIAKSVGKEVKVTIV